MLEKLEQMLASGKDSALLRFSIGSEHFKHGDPAAAAAHLRKAVALDPKYAAAWKLLGKANQRRVPRARLPMPGHKVSLWPKPMATSRRRGK